MPEAIVGTVHTPDRGLGAHLTQAAQGLSTFVDDNLMREVKRHVYLYSVADRELWAERPPLFSRLLIPAKPRDAAYAVVTSLPDPYPQLDRDSNDQVFTRSYDGRRIAMDICNPANLGLDQDAATDSAVAIYEGGSLGDRGVFWSLNSPPAAAEIAAAVARKERYYRRLLQTASELEMSAPAKLQELVNRDYHNAASYFGVQASWHRELVRQEMCPNCGDPVKQGVAYHKNADGLFCVIDWKRTVAAGVRTRGDVPEELRWWVEPVEEAAGTLGASRPARKI